MPGKSPHAHERPAWHAPAQRPRTGRCPGAAARPHPRGMSFCPSKAISHPVPKPRLRGLSRAMAPRLSLPTGALRANASRPPRTAQQKGPVGASRPRPTQKAPSKAACGKSARPFLGPPSPQPSTNDSSRRKRNGHPPKRRRILPKANAPVPPHRDPPHKRLPSPAKRAEKSPRRGPTDHIQRRKPHQKPRVERARGLSLARHPRSHQQTTLRAAKETGMPRCAGASSQRQTCPSLPTGTLRANASRPPRNAQQKGPAGSQPTASNAESPIKKPHVERARGLSLGPPSPQPPTNDSSRRKRNGHPPGAGTSSQRQTRPSLPTGTLRANASRETRGKSPPEGTSRPPPTPAQRFPSLRPVFPGTPPRMGMRPGKSGAFRHHTRRLAHLTLLSRAESAQPGALGMPANAKIALIYKNQVRFCFPGWRTFSTPGAPLTALPRAPRCRVRG